MGDPYVQLLSLIDPDQASIEFHNARGGTPNANITYNAANSTSSAPDSTTLTLPSEVAATLDKIGIYFPTMLALMAFNALILVILVIVGIFFLCRTRTKKSRIPRGRKSPMPMRRASDVESLRPPQPHAYQPVSMALTEDTMFTPPSPGFRKFGNDAHRKSSAYRASVAVPEDSPFIPPSIQPGDRPNSSIYRGSMVVPEDMPFTPPSPARSARSSTQHPAAPEDDVLVPPSPSYHSFEGVVRNGDRPPSAVSQNAGFALADEVIFPPRALQGNGFRPQSVASQHVGVALNDDAVFAPPRALQGDNIQPGSRPQSGTSQYIGVALTDDAVFVPPHTIQSDSRPGSRPQSSVSQQIGVALTDDTIFLPPRAVQGGSRPQSVASQRIGITLTDDGVAVSPRSIQGDNLRPPPQSIASQDIGVALTDDDLFVPPSRAFLPFQNSALRPGDRPQSFATPPGTIPPPHNNTLSPPSPGFYSFDRSGDRPRSIA